MRRLRLVAATALALVAAPAAMPASASAAGLPADWDRGFNYTAWWHDSYGTADADTSMLKMTRTGANSIAIIANWYQASPTASTIAADASRSPSDASIATAVRRAKARGLKVMLRPWAESSTGGWRGSFAPASVSQWFSTYRTMSAHYANLAQSLGVDAIDIGSEYRSLEHHEAEWRSVIATVRSRFDGELSYGANVGDHAKVRFWDALDRIGIDAYFPLSKGDTPSVGGIVSRWNGFTDQWGGYHRYIDDIAATQARFDKPVVFTEVGYPSNTNPLQDPWGKGGTYSGAEQQRALEAVFTAFAAKPWFKGMYVWQWNWKSTYGGVGNTDHTPQNKPAEATITAWYSAPATTPPAPDSSTPTPRPPAPAPGTSTTTPPTTITTPVPTETTATVTRKRRGRGARIARRTNPLVVVRGRVARARYGTVLIRARLHRPLTDAWPAFATKRVRLTRSGRFRALIRPPRGTVAVRARFLGTSRARGSHAPRLVFRITRRGALVRR